MHITKKLCKKELCKFNKVYVENLLKISQVFIEKSLTINRFYYIIVLERSSLSV